MKIFHTADWHLGKLVQGVYMTEEQGYILNEFTKAVEMEKPDVIILAGDIYDRAVPPTEAVLLFDKVLHEIVVKHKIPLLAIAGNHDSPSRLHFGSQLMKENGYFIAGKIDAELEPIILNDEFGEVHFHLVPFADPSIIRTLFEDDEIINHHDAMAAIVKRIEKKMDPAARHVLIGHAFVTKHGEVEENTSDSERPLAIGGAEYVAAHLFKKFDYVALGHLHQAHFVLNEKIQYAGSPLKYSISEENHKKCFLHVLLNKDGSVEVEKRLLIPCKDMRTVEGTIHEIEQLPASEDFIFVKLLDETPVLFPMEKVRAIFPNAMHVERKITRAIDLEYNSEVNRKQLTNVQLFESFYKEMIGEEVREDTIKLFEEVLHEVTREEDDVT